MTQRTLFPEKALLKLQHNRPLAMSGDDFFATIITGVLLLGFLCVYIGSYATEIGERIPRKPQLERQSVNIDNRLDVLYTKSILLKYKAKSMVVDMGYAYKVLRTPLNYGMPSNDRFYKYYYAEVE